MYAIVPITSNEITTSKEMRETFAFAVMGPYKPGSPLQAFWPCKTRRDAETLLTHLEVYPGDWPPWEEDWTPREREAALRIYK